MVSSSVNLLKNNHKISKLILKNSFHTGNTKLDIAPPNGFGYKPPHRRDGAPPSGQLQTALGCSQVVRQRFLVSCTVGSNPTTPANFLPKDYYIIAIQ